MTPPAGARERARPAGRGAVSRDESFSGEHPVGLFADRTRAHRFCNALLTFARYIDERSVEDVMIRDLRYAVRLLLHSKIWTAVVVMSLALGIGANTAIFTAVNSLLLRTLPGVDHPETLVRFRNFGENEMGNSFSSYGY